MTVKVPSHGDSGVSSGVERLSEANPRLLHWDWSVRHVGRKVSNRQRAVTHAFQRARSRRGASTPLKLFCTCGQREAEYDE